jgi:hypothetical protein
MSNVTRKMRRRDLIKKRAEDKAYYGQCDEVVDINGISVRCELDAASEHLCLTCVQLEDAGKKAKGENGQVHRRKVCPVHRGAALEAVKKHALVAHPVNMLKMAVAVLRGDE